jgi:hypothetical protein
LKLRVDIYNCEGCGRAIVAEENHEIEVCPYKDCSSIVFEYSHSGHVVND